LVGEFGEVVGGVELFYGFVLVFMLCEVVLFGDEVVEWVVLVVEWDVVVYVVIGLLLELVWLLCFVYFMLVY